MTGERKLVFALGSNLGDRAENLQEAVDALFDAPGLEAVAVSPVYETVPIGGEPQDDYLNAVVVCRTGLPAEVLLDRARNVEDAMGRTRQRRWGPRVIDVDIVVLGSETWNTPELTVPHPRAHERAFVLRPWSDVDPEAEIPGVGPLDKPLNDVRDQRLRLRDDVVIRIPD